MQVPKANVQAAKKVAEEIYEMERKVKLGKRVKFQQLLNAAWRLANLVSTIEERPIKIKR